MHNNQKLKKLARIAAASKTVPADIEEFVLTCLNKMELKTFLNFYKNALAKERVYITSSQKVSDESMSQLKKMYADKEIVTVIDEELGAGIKLQHDDLVVDFTFKKYINDTIEKLKN